ncbi:hypothetical protein CE91St41_01000 [Oscillospiraceae bacterium]|nr:hypothetical protein CE91St40_01000 [Oscillospiraceae bacterium]BDF73211.1 hypothetical protein CE91St41_01000 [Oscillospiraceae bacterium]
MKTRVLSLALALALIFSVGAVAVTPRYTNPIDVWPDIVASSSGVKCSVDITPIPGTRLTVSGTVTLYRAGGYLTSWPVSGLEFKETYTPVSRGTYRMDYDITVKGTAGTDHLTGTKSDTY